MQQENDDHSCFSIHQRVKGELKRVKKSLRDAENLYTHTNKNLI